MEPEERARLEKLDTIVRSDDLCARINPVVDRVRAALSQKPEALMTWEPIPLEIFGQKLPQEIRSGWIFVLRAGADTGAERHPNSHQRMMTLHGSGDMRVRAEVRARHGKPSTGVRALHGESLTGLATSSSTW